MVCAQKKFDVNTVLENAIQAAGIFTQFDQKGTDDIVKAVCAQAFKHRIRLAKMAQEETGIGKWEDKTIKNILATQYVYQDIKDMKTVGKIYENEKEGQPNAYKGNHYSVAMG